MLLINWLEPYTQHRKFAANVAEDIDIQQGNLEALSRRLGAQEELASILNGKVHALLMLTGMDQAVTRWNEVGAGQIHDDVLRKWTEASGLARFMKTINAMQDSILKELEWDGMIFRRLGYHDRQIRVINVLAGIKESDFKSYWGSGELKNAGNVILKFRPLLLQALESVEKMQQTLAMEAGKSMRLATLHAMIDTTKDEGNQARLKMLGEVEEALGKVKSRFDAVDAMRHLLGMELQEHGQPGNMDAWRSEWMNQNAACMIGMEAILGVVPHFDNKKFAGYSWVQSDDFPEAEEAQAPGEGISMFHSYLGIMRQLKDHQGDLDDILGQ